jgi:uncharacterized protein YkwD
MQVGTVKPRLGVEILEGRDCPAVNLSYGILTITGTDGADNLLVTQKSGTITAQGQTFEASAVTRVVMTGLDGRDVIRNYTAKPATLYGGVGNDALYGGTGNDILYGGHGRDVLYARAGNDILFGGSGADTLNGGSGSDRGYRGSPSSTRTNSDLERRIINQINAERASQGAPAFKVNLRLNVAAYLHSRDMAAISDRSSSEAALEHVLYGTTRPQPLDRFDAAGYDNWTFSFLYGENIAYGYPDAESLLADWMGSTSNRNNILSRSFSEIGVSVVRNSSGELFFTVVFGSRG